MILHTLNAPPTSPAFADCLLLLGGEDAVLLLGDGVYAALEGTEPLQALRNSGIGVYMLGADAAAAGIQNPPDGVQTIDIEGFVALTERFSRQLAWY